MLIILEGPNGAGKSTIAKALNPDVLEHRGPPTHDTAYGEWVEPLIEHTLNEDNPLIVLDRWHLGEAIYPSMVGRERLANDLELKQISRTISGMFGSRCMLVYVLPPREVLKARFEGRGEHWQVGLVNAEIAHGRYLELISDKMHDNMQHRILSSDASVAAFIDTYANEPTFAHSRTVGL